LSLHSFPTRRSSDLIIPRSTAARVIASGSSSRSEKNEPLFLPSSQMSDAQREVLRSTGLGIEDMTDEELTEMLEGEGETSRCARSEEHTSELQSRRD